MENKPEAEQLITRYLLGESSSSEDQMIAEKYASDPSFLNVVEMVEDDLVDAYVGDELLPAQRASFEQFFLMSPENHDKMEFAAALARRIHREPAVNQTLEPSVSGLARVVTLLQGYLRSPRIFDSTLPIVVAVSLLIVFAVGLWLVSRNRGSQSEPHQLYATGAERDIQSQPSPKVDAIQQTPLPRTTPSGVQNEAVANSVNRTKVPKTITTKPAVLASFTLAPGLTRTAGVTKTLRIPRNVQVIRLQLSIDSPSSYQSYRVSLRQLGGAEIWNHEIKNHRPDGITLTLSANILKNGPYLLTVSGITSKDEAQIVGDYPFQVTKE